MHDTQYVFDVSRLINRNIKKRRMTGVDNVLVGFISGFSKKYNFFFRFKIFFFIFSEKSTEYIFKKISSEQKISKVILFCLCIANIFYTFIKIIFKHKYYFNLGHSGLDNSFHIFASSLISKKRVVLIHDLIPIKFPEYSIPNEDKRHEKRLKNIIQISDKIILNSEITRKQFKDWLARHNYDFSSLDMKVIKPVSSLNFQLSKKRKYYCMVGTIEPRKGYMEILNLFLEATDPPFPLIIIGQEGWMCDDEIKLLQNLSKINKLTWYNDCSNKDLEKILSNSKGLIQNSSTEGFGIPIIEALDNGLEVFIKKSKDIEIFNNSGVNYYKNINELQSILKKHEINEFINSSNHRNTWFDASRELYEFIEK